MLLQLPCAFLLALSFGWPAGPWAAALALPWLAVTGIVALAGLARLWQRRFLPLEELCFDAGLLYLAIGGGWTVLARGGIRPLGFAPVIVLLTAVHFHFAGFALPLLTGLAGHALGGGVWSRIASLGVIAGIPLVAVGITASQLGLGPVLEGVAAVVTACAGLLTAALHLRLASRPRPSGTIRALWLVTGLCLAGGMILAALYGLRSWISISWLDVPWMWALHGTANSIGVGVGGLAAWSWASRFREGRTSCGHSTKTASDQASEEEIVDSNFVIYRGTRMIEGWPAKIREAQSIRTYRISGKTYERVSYGKERDDWHADKVPCHDCRVLKGELHVVGCDVEECPACHEQAISCDCEHEES